MWFNQYTQKGGDAVDFFRYFYGESEEQAAAMLLNCSVADLEKLPARSPTAFPRTKQEEPKQLEIPLANATMRRVFAYLCQTRGIDPEVVSAFAHARLLYESAGHHNAVFVGRDGQGKVRHLHARGTLTGSHFRQTLPGSEKAYSFHWQGSSRKLYAFEAPIDLCWKPSPSCRKSSCAWITMKPVTKPPDALPRNCCGSGMSPYPLSFPSRRTGTMNCSPFAQKKAKG